MIVVRRARSAVVVSAAAVAVAGLGVSLAYAATTGARSGLRATWTVSPGGSVTAKSATFTFKDTKTGTVLTCTSSAAAGTIKSGSGLSGTAIAEVTASSFSGCTGPAGLSFTGTPSHLPYQVNALSFNSTTGASTGTVTGIHGTLSGSGCDATVDGTSPTSDNGTLKGTYTNSTGRNKISLSGGNLHFYNVAGCFGLISNGDPVTVSGTETVTPRQIVTSP